MAGGGGVRAARTFLREGDPGAGKPMTSPPPGSQIGDLRTVSPRAPWKCTGMRRFRDRAGPVRPASLSRVCCPLVDLQEIAQAHFGFAFAGSLWVLWVHLQLGAIKTLLS